MTHRNLTICHNCDRLNIGSCGVAICQANGKDIVDNAEADECPGNKFSNSSPDLHAITRALWKELHETAAGWTGTLAEWIAWLDKWLARVPCGECRQHAAEWIKANPPTLPPFPWTVDFHNSVNRKLEKAETSIETASLVYSWKE